MNKKLTEELYNKYPKIFRQRKLSIKESLMPFGFECNDGWFFLIYSLCNLIQNHCDSIQRYEKKDFQVEVTQVKEKYGTLRMYLNYEDDYISGAISLAEYLSYKICEQCGSTDGVTQTEGWISTLCQSCMTKRNENKK